MVQKTAPQTTVTLQIFVLALARKRQCTCMPVLSKLDLNGLIREVLAFVDASQLVSDIQKRQP